MMLMKQIIFKNVVGVALRTQRRYKIILDRKKMHEWRNIVKVLRKNKYDVLFDSTEGLKYKQVYLLNRVNAIVNVGYNKDEYKIYNKNIKQNNTLKMIQIYRQMLESVNVEIKDTKAFSKSTGEELTGKVEKMSKSKNNGVGPDEIVK